MHFLFAETTPATILPFIITNKSESIQFIGYVAYGNGYSTPGATLNICDYNAVSDSDYYKTEKANNRPQGCHWTGLLYELDGVDTQFAFSAGRKQNPILFPGLHKRFYYKRNVWGIGNVSIPKDVWTFKECKKE